jgi:hypothetical protein
MDKKVQMYLGLGVLVAVGYYIWEKSAKDKANDAAKAAAAASTAAPVDAVAPTVAKMSGFAGLDADSVVGDRKGMVGMDATMKQNAVVKDSAFAWGNFAGGINGVIKDGTFASADGSISSNFFHTEDSPNNFRNR